MPLRPCVLPNGKVDMRAVPLCRCARAVGLAGGCCGLCGGGIPEHSHPPHESAVARELYVWNSDPEVQRIAQWLKDNPHE